MFRILAAVLIGGAFVALGSDTSRRESFEVWCTGNCDKDFTPSSTEPGVVLMGGGVSVPVICGVASTVVLFPVLKVNLPKIVVVTY